MLVGGGVRLAALYGVAANGGGATGMDAVDYLELGSNILNHGVCSTWTAGFKTISARPPLYPLAIASVYRFSGTQSVFPLLVLNVCFDMLALFLMFLVARKLAGNAAGLVAAGIYATFGHAAYYATMVGPHTLSVALLLALALCVISIGTNYWITLPAFAMTLAALIHIRPVFLLVAPFAFLIAYFQIAHGEKAQDKLHSPWRRIFKSALPILLVVLLCVPWGVRNFSKHRALIPVCTISGWHLGGASELDMQLPLDALMKNIYDPAHRGFSEADYFLLARRKFFRALLDHPFLLPMFGVARIVIGWSPPTPWRRFFLPKAYVFPLYLNGGFFLPLIDFEGLLYFFIFALLAFSIRLGRRMLRALAEALKASWPLAALVAAYSAVHIIGFPLISYRFIIEPLLIVLGVIITLHLVAVLKTKWKGANPPDWLAGIVVSPRAPGPLELGTINTVAAIMALFIVLPLLGHGAPKTFQYPPMHPSPTEKTYAELRAVQWRNMGDIPTGTRAIVAGVVKYLNPGYKHVPNLIEPVRDNLSVAGRLFVGYGDAAHPLGIGDIKVNFKRGRVPRAGSAIVVKGKVVVGTFKWIIMDVDDFSVVPPSEAP